MIAADSSVLVPAIVASHEFHNECHAATSAVDAAIGHAIVESYAVLTRLPHPYRVPPAEAAAALASYASHALVLPGDEIAELLDRFVATRAAGGSSYDVLIAATAAHHGATLLTRDERAAAIYERIGATIRWVATP